MSQFNATDWQPQKGNTEVIEKKSGKKKGPTVTVKATILWAELRRQNKMSNKYQVVLSDLSEAAVAELIEKLNLKDRIQWSDERGNYMTVKSGYEIEAFDEDDKPIEQLIANGSKALVTLGSYHWTYSGKEGYSPSIVRLQVTELIPFSRDDEAQPTEVF